MIIIIHGKDQEKIAQAVSDEIIIGKEQDALDLMVHPQLQGARKIIIERKNIIPEFFDLSTRIAGNILQKFVTYRIKLAIVGDFKNVTSKSLKSFIYESNRGNEIFFVEDIEIAISKLSPAK